MEHAIEALKDFRAHMDGLGIGHYRAVATSAVRESKNGNELVKRAESEAGIRLEVISGSEEAHLVLRAVARHVVLGDDQWILADLGGGSVEVSLVDRAGILWSESHTMGSVRLLEELTEASAEPGRFLRLLTEYTQTLHMPSGVDREALGGYIATGGNIESLAILAGTEHRDGVDRVSTKALRSVIERLAQLSFRERVENLGLREDRADVILPAAMVYERLAELADTREILVPHVGIKEGVLYDLVDRLVSREDHGSRRTRELESSARALGRKYLFDEEHAGHVTQLALSLFEQLTPLHGLDDSNQKILRAAALLHDIGQFVSYKGHHKHTLYLVIHSELPTFSAREMLLVANVARYHRKAEPSDHHEHFTQLSKPDRDRVRRLAALLRVADALDREHVSASATGHRPAFPGRGDADSRRGRGHDSGELGTETQGSVLCPGLWKEDHSALCR